MNFHDYLWLYNTFHMINLLVLINYKIYPLPFPIPSELLTKVTSPTNSITGGPVISSTYPSLISFSSFTFPGIPYRIFLRWLPCHFYLVVIEQQLWIRAAMQVVKEHSHDNSRGIVTQYLITFDPTGNNSPVQSKTNGKLNAQIPLRFAKFNHHILNTFESLKYL